MGVGDGRNMAVLLEVNRIQKGIQLWRDLWRVMGYYVRKWENMGLW